jgi:hypothetical protein
MNLSRMFIAPTISLAGGLHSIGTPGFEPGASCSQSRRATRLRHVPSGRSLVAARERIVPAVQALLLTFSLTLLGGMLAGLRALASQRRVEPEPADPPG